VDWEVWRREKSPFEDVLGFFQVQSVIDMCKGGDILDVGCGDGYLTKELLKHFNNITGIDESEVSVNKARKNALGSKIIKTSIEKFAPKQKFDTILLINVLEHLPDPVEKLRIISKWLKSDGEIIIHVPNAYSMHRRIGAYMKLLHRCTDLNDADRAIGHQIVFDTNSLADTIAKSSLSIAKKGGLFIKPLSGPQMLKLYNMPFWENQKQRDLYFQALNTLGTEIPELSSIIYAVCKKSDQECAK